MSDKKPYFVAVFIQLAYTGYFMTSKAAFDKGMSTFVFIFYRHIAASLLLASLAAIFQRKSSTPLTFTISLKLFLHAIIGIPLSLNLYNTGLKYTSASVASAIANCSPVFTFSIAVLFRREIFRTKRLSGISKVLGITLCLIGVLIVALYKGPHWSLHHHLFGHNQRHRSQEPVLPDKRWIEGTLLMITSAMATSLWLVLQGFLLKEYPPKLLFTTIECLFGTLQSLFVALVFERDSSKWKLHLDMGFLAILYCGFVVTGVAFYLQTWCLEKKGPVFLSIFTPLSLVFTLIISTLAGEVVHLGSILGAILMAGGLYGVLWGKSMESLPGEVTIEDGKSCVQEKEAT
ncbi:WAT1-related protein At5g64700-like isoform X2 [Zingiber officinale]|uniref:WAT1-related protein At5g64700-like isoform X2 n=1 Tax=Zingiber officinale TaxID=94328 RepID=UPI001C4B9922|nr:WAT1-related protein At5g64700-like isoform X2 [Zingiber officinale]